MSVPSPNSHAGRILRVLRDGKPRSRAQIRDESGMHPDAEVCRRIRDLRALGIDIECTERPGPKKNQRVFEYRISYLPPHIRQLLNNETDRSVA